MTVTVRTYTITGMTDHFLTRKPSQWSNPDGSAKTIASYTKEQTARFLSGGEIGRPKIHDPELADKMERERDDLREAFTVSINALIEATAKQSERTARRLTELANASFEGNNDALRLLTAMVGELLKEALVVE